ncbi:MAG: DUF3592 domain-containing protein [Halopseudomonas sabulinigri]|tara:strand:- start:184 stop:660 length:477 start_codon:yes stop_codon:yes gene_type:complete
MPSPYLEIFIVLCTELIAIICALAYFGGIWDLYKAWDSSEWKETKGRILYFGVTTSDEGDGPATYHTTIEYKYIVDAQIYRSSEVGFLGMRAATKRNAEALIKHLREPGDLSVFYNPRKPQESVLLPGLSKGHILSGAYVSGVTCWVLYALFQVWVKT